MHEVSLDEWHVLSPKLDEALEMTSEERVNWLSSLQTQNPVIAEQLEKLLFEHRALMDERFLERRSVELPAVSTLAGQTVGVYRLISQIGQGGMSSVWLAKRNDGRFERQVAVKFLNVALMGEIGEQRFKREGRILGLLVHSHIAELLDAGVSRTGQPYLVLEYIEGDHIDRYCDHHRLDVETRIRLFLDVLEAVAHAHAHRIVHRDLKPSNILIGKDNQVKLLDFGIAKLLESDGHAEESTRFTVTAGRAMTPEYAAPEQLKGEAITRATDVYALGVLLHVLLTGRHPSGTRTQVPADLVRAVVDAEPTRPSDAAMPTRTSEEIARTNAAYRAATPEKLRNVLRGDLDTIVVKALKKNPSERYSSVTAMAEDLRRYLRREPICAQPDTIAYRALGFVRRHSTTMALASSVVAVTSAAVMCLWMHVRTARS